MAMAKTVRQPNYISFEQCAMQLAQAINIMRKHSS
jgi:hypothetical protein